MGTAVKEVPIAQSAEAVLTLPERDHLEGCPMSRVERYEAARPGKVVLLANGQAARASDTTVIVTRCVECGGERVTDTEGNRL